MKRFILIILLSSFVLKTNTVEGQKIQLSEESNISLLTCSPGTEIYSLFGHTSLRVKDPKKGIDVVFNYGLFDYTTPNFTMKFIRGKLLYQVGREPFKRFAYQYSRDNREVREQIFNFNQEEKQEVFEFLVENVKPENASYKYDFFFDNCSSRIRDLLKIILRESLSFTPPTEKTYNSFRSQLDYYLDGNYTKYPWTNFGMDLILGIPADQTADFEGEMFLPDHISNNFTFGKIRNSVSLVQASKVIVPFQSKTKITSTWLTPNLFFWTLCGFTGLLFLIKNNRVKRIYDFILFTILGLAGILFVFMWVGTDHGVCHKNMNILWMFPLHILLAINILRRSINGFWKKYILASIIVNVLLLILWKILPQDFHAATFPFLLLATMRLVDNFKSNPNELT